MLAAFGNLLDDALLPDSLSLIARADRGGSITEVSSYLSVESNNTIFGEVCIPLEKRSLRQ
jgi:hypothetical protein